MEVCGCHFAGEDPKVCIPITQRLVHPPSVRQSPAERATDSCMHIDGAEIAKLEPV